MTQTQTRLAALDVCMKSLYLCELAKKFGHTKDAKKCLLIEAQDMLNELLHEFCQCGADERYERLYLHLFDAYSWLTRASRFAFCDGSKWENAIELLQSAREDAAPY
jgi:hypothetical protein